MDYILEVKNLKKEYANFTLKDVSFKLPKGAIMGFIGENGAGKTTTIKIILDIIKNYQGEVTIMGMDLKNHDQEIKENIGVVLDDMFFPDVVTPSDIDKIMKDVYQNWDSKMFYDFLKEFSLIAKNQIKTFSKGMRKKLEIATALAHHPKLLILDEPTSGLDPVARAEVIDLFQNFIQNEECSVLFSSHITSDLEHIADYITFINNGEIVLSKTCDELLNNYAIVKCGSKDFAKLKPDDYLKYRKNKYNYEILIDNKKQFKKKYELEIIDKITLDELMVLMVKGVK